jgi:putative membrane protein
MKKASYLLLATGLTIFTVLIVHHGVTDVAAALVAAGWGLLWVALFHLAPMAVATFAWFTLLRGRSHPPFRAMLFVRWISESVKGLLPVAHVGGDLVKARLISHRGLAGDIAGASVIVDLTLSVVTQIIFTLVGVALLLFIGAPKLVIPVVISIAVMGVLMTAFYFLQRRGLFGGIMGIISRLSGKRDWTGGAKALDSSINSIYMNRSALLSSSLWRFAAWIVGAGEVWLALYFLDTPTTLTNAILLESLGQAVRSAAFLVPGALGVQEGGYLLLGVVVGLTPEVALALSLIKRVRVLLLGLPGLIAWQISEGKRLRRLQSRHRAETHVSS